MKTQKTDIKSCILMAVWFFYSAVPTAQNSPELIICFLDSFIQCTWSNDLIYLWYYIWEQKQGTKSALDIEFA